VEVCCLPADTDHRPAHVPLRHEQRDDGDIHRALARGPDRATMARGGRRVDEALSAPQAVVPATAGRAQHFGASRPHTSV
jgi:hypothetical protein